MTGTFRIARTLYGCCVHNQPMAKVDAAVVEAERVLADRREIVLDAEQWERFVEVLDRPPQENPGLAKLFSKPSVFTAT